MLKIRENCNNSDLHFCLWLVGNQSKRYAFLLGLWYCSFFSHFLTDSNFFIRQICFCLFVYLWHTQWFLYVMPASAHERLWGTKSVSKLYDVNPLSGTEYFNPPVNRSATVWWTSNIETSFKPFSRATLWEGSLKPHSTTQKHQNLNLSR